ncbi:NERD domain-containing protein [Nocardia sp. BSTN01]|uniref:nuclease-related domain-containing protein n=1 Tax=Nocardia sp. BSTN01 TaxID=2783665 RepID=UPI0035CCF261
MLIINGDITKPKTEQQVIEWLANYVTHPGIAVSGVYVPRLDGGSTEAGLLVFTPYAVAVLEVDVPRKKVRGPLSCSMNERWSAPGIHGDPVRLRGDDLNPLHQVRRPVSALRTFVAELTRGPEPFVDGMILLIPKAGNTLTLDKGPTPGGFTVLAGDSASQLYSWFGRTAQHRDRTPWTAELVVTVLTALRVDRTRDAESRRRLYADLVAEGFPTEVPAARREGDPEPAASTPPPADAPAHQPKRADMAGPNLPVAPSSSRIAPSRPESNPTAPPTSAAAFTSSETSAAQPEMTEGAESNAQVTPANSHISPSRRESNPTAPPTPASASMPSGVPAPPTSPAPLSPTSPVSYARPARPRRTPDDAPAPATATATATRVDPTPAVASTSDSTPAPTGADAPTTEPTKSAPIPPSAPPRKTDEPALNPSLSDTVAPTTPITSPQADAPEPNRHEPDTDFTIVDPRPQPPANHRLRTALLGIAAALILVCGIGYMAGKDHPRAQPGSQPAPSQVRPPEKTTTPASISPTPTPESPHTQQRSTTPTEGATCYPFQAGC